MTEFVYQGDDFEDKVRKQVEFYFSDSNLQQDKFLWKIYEANDGWVELKTILTFGRMKQYRPEEKVIEALRSSKKLELSANNDMIKRIDPLKDFNEIKNTKKRNTVHIEGFPHDLTQEQVEAWFEEKIAPHLQKEKAINSVRRIKSKAKKEFFGVVDVELTNEEDAQYLVKDVEISFDQGILSKEAAQDIDKKDLLKKMTLLTFQEMRESGKRFGQNEVTKRRNSFNENNKGKKQKGGKGKKFDRKKGGDGFDSAESNEKGNASESAIDDDKIPEADESKEAGELKKEDTTAGETAGVSKSTDDATKQVEKNNAGVKESADSNDQDASKDDTKE
ncbi:La domain family protein [Candida parapsilosis]|uniref:HTH La-type RNA-binding domain-containing protein n=2 Tax=Candida parapsilosis TaxID=5480 RepID=G8BD75_CANPC|nr:uncharacterized protein CPAR2_208650 [Candida parapsilosis]KAF6054629.1 La domain family protein [Candida parapsilosis]KAF6056345.1 La domain family protein [Candida parapsilosis]KAF6059279.1 La domain family protein [Candida parapsilosis]KAF6068035.1 La domain family protein [Candida parapsilosis]KAI5904072.1 La protein [Candida parapsilosis]